MQTLSHSAFLQALGYAIANSLWQTAILWFVVMSVNGIFKFSSTVKYRISLTAQIGGFIWFAVTLFYYYQTSAQALAQAQIMQIASNSILTEQAIPEYKNNLLSFIVQAERVLPYLSIAYLFLLSFLVFKWIKSYRYTTLIQHNGLQKIDVEWKLFVKKLAAELGIKADVKIYLSEIVTSPLTIGFLKPVILIPVAGMNHLTVQQLEAVILHEMAHIRRFDYLINLFVSVIELCLFFNPFTQLLSRMIKNERENSCDDWVLQYQYQPAMYAEALLRIAYLQSAPSLAMAAAANKQVLLTRIKRMLDQNQSKFNYRQHLVALLLMTGILSSLAWYQPNTKSPAKTDILQASVIEPLAVKVDNPLFNPVFFLSKPLKEEVKKTEIEIEKKLREAQIAIKKMNLPSLSAAGTAQLRQLNLISKLDEGVAALESELSAKEKDIAALKLATLTNANVAGWNVTLFSDSIVFTNGQLATLFTTVNAQAPVVINFDKVADEMKKAKEDMLRLSKQGWKTDEKAFENQMKDFVRLAPVAAYFSDDMFSKQQTWFQSEQAEMKKATDRLRESNQKLREANESLLAKQREALRKLKSDSVRYAPTTRVASGQNVWYSTVSSAKEDDDKKPGVFKMVTPQGFSFSMTEGSVRKKQNDIIGPPEEDEVITVGQSRFKEALRLSGTATVPVRRQGVSAASGGGAQTRSASAPKPTAPKDELKTIIVDGKLIETKDIKARDRKVLRVESF